MAVLQWIDWPTVEDTSLGHYGSVEALIKLMTSAFHDVTPDLASAADQVGPV